MPTSALPTSGIAGLLFLSPALICESAILWSRLRAMYEGRVDGPGKGTGDRRSVVNRSQSGSILFQTVIANGAWQDLALDTWDPLISLRTYVQQQRKVPADPGTRAEEGRATSLVYSSSFAADSDSLAPAETRRRPHHQPPTSAPQNQVRSMGMHGCHAGMPSC